MYKSKGFVYGFFGIMAMAFMLNAGADAAHQLTPSEQLGKSIFFDNSLSINKNQSCATCHDPGAGWTGPDPIINLGGSVYKGSIAGRFGNRKPPAASYATFSPVLHYNRKEKMFVGGNFWDGRATGKDLGNPAADQAQGPFLNPAEHALRDSACVVYRVCNPLTPNSYPVSFENVWGTSACDISWPSDIEKSCSTEDGPVALTPEVRTKVDMAYDDVARAIAAYEASPEVNAFSSKYDYSLEGRTELTKEEKRGLALFKGKGKCNECHLIKGKKPLFTDFTYDNLGVPVNPENPANIADPQFVDTGLGGFLETGPEWKKHAPENMGKHKVTTLRNVDKRPRNTFVKAYMHNGYFKTLKGLVHFYNTRDVKPLCPGPYSEAQALAGNCWPEPEIKENVNKDELGNLGLTDDEEEALVAFMKTLSDGFVPEKKKE